MEEGHVIKYVNRFSGGLKQKKEFNIIIFWQGPFFTAGIAKNKQKKKEKRKSYKHVQQKKKQIPFFWLQE